MNVFVGIDGGATKTRVVLVDDSGALIAESSAGSSNHQVAGVAGAQSQIVHALEQALALAGIDGRSRPDTERGAIARVVGGFAGLDGPADTCAVAQVMEGAANHLRLHVPWIAVNDAVVAWAGALEGQPGAIVVSGTGAIAFAVNESGEVARSDGWGHWVGDEGSGFDIGRRGIRAALRAFDGRGEKTALMAALGQHCLEQGLGDWQEWIARLNSEGEIAHSQIAAFAPVVCTTASSGDAAAQAILSQAGQHLAATVWSVVRRVRLDKEDLVPVAIVGSVLSHDRNLCRHFGDALSENCRGCQIRWPALDPAEGAAFLAREPDLLPSGVLRVRLT
jgi:N-acetylglucosamine kinase-like BadF-type ATPase